MKKIITKDKACLQCKNKFNRGFLRSGRPEAIEDFKIRKFCSKRCYWKYNSGSNHWLWKGGLRKNREGYLRDSNDQFFHRVVMEKYLGRKLRKNEVVHHINGDRLDNRTENLELTTNSRHRKYHVKTQKRNNKGRFYV